MIESKQANNNNNKSMKSLKNVTGNSNGNSRVINFMKFFIFTSKAEGCTSHLKARR